MDKNSRQEYRERKFRRKIKSIDSIQKKATENNLLLYRKKQRTIVRKGCKYVCCVKIGDIPFERLIYI